MDVELTPAQLTAVDDDEAIRVLKDINCDFMQPRKSTREEYCRRHSGLIDDGLIGFVESVDDDFVTDAGLLVIELARAKGVR